MLRIITAGTETSLAIKDIFRRFMLSCWTLCNAVDCSPPGSSVHGVLQARTLEWVAMPFSRDRPDPGIKCKSPPLQAYSSPHKPPGNPSKMNRYLYIL